MVQERYDEMITLLRRHGESFPILYELLALCSSSVLIFSYFDKPSTATRRQNVVDAYEIRSIIKQRKENDHSISSSLLHRLRETEHAHICVSIFITNHGVYTIFSDFERTDIVGALYTREQPKEPPVYSHLFQNGRLVSRER